MSEVGVNWGTFPSSANLASWFREVIQDMHTHTSHNKHDGVAHHQPGGTATFACMELVRYHNQKGDDFSAVFVDGVQQFSMQIQVIVLALHQPTTWADKLQEVIARFINSNSDTFRLMD